MRSWLFRTTSRVSLVAALLLGGLAVAGISSWIAIEGAAERVNSAMELTVQLQEALDAARGAQVHFKMQVQEWKDILLRGREPLALQRHVENFARESDRTENRLLELRVVLTHLGLHGEAASEALRTHQRVVERYRQALDAFNRADHGNARDVDAMVTAIDREPMRQIGAIVDYVRGESARLLDVQRQGAFDRTQAAKLVLVSVVCGALVAALLVLFAYSRERLQLRSLGASATTGNWAVAAALVLAVVALAALVGRTTGNALAAAQRVAHPHEMRAHLEQLKAEVNAADEAARDFASERNPETERDFQAAAQAVRSRIAEIGALPDPGFGPGEVARLDETTRTALAYDDALVQARRDDGAQIARRMLAADGAGALHDAIGQIDQLLARQRALVTLRETSLDGEVSLLHWSLFATGALVLLMLAAVVLLLLRDQRQRRVAQAQLESENRRLDEAVRERTASLAHANAELQRLSRRYLQRQEQESRRLSVELDHEISHQLAALLMNLQRIVRTLSASGDQVLVADLQDSINVAKLTYREICELAVDLRPVMLDQLGLAATLQWFAREAHKGADCQIEVHARPLAREPGGEIATVAYRIVQESVRNALQHGEAGRITIELGERGDVLELSITDDGRGFAADAVSADALAPGGLGLPVMRQRAASIGATLKVVSSPGAGTQVLFSVPMAEPQKKVAGA
jgi:signal transduction histidine kinase